MLRTGEDGLTILDAFEGDELTGYICPAGIRTIGRGHTERDGIVIHYADGTQSTKVIVGKKIKPAESRRLRDNDVDDFEDSVEAVLKRPATPNQFDAMTLLAFNIGRAGFKGSTVLRKFNAGDVAGASKAFEAWNKATIKGKKVVVKGLVRRRAAEQALFDGDIEKAYAIAQTTRHLPMPQAIEPPKKAQSLLDNNEVIGGTVTTAVAGTGLVSKAQDASDTLYTVQGLKDAVTGVFGDLNLSTMLYLGGGALAIYLIVRGWKHWRDNEVDGDEAEAVDVEDEA